MLTFGIQNERMKVFEEMDPAPKHHSVRNSIEHSKQ